MRHWPEMHSSLGAQGDESLSQVAPTAPLPVPTQSYARSVVLKTRTAPQVCPNDGHVAASNGLHGCVQTP